MIPAKVADLAVDAVMKAVKNPSVHRKAIEGAGAFALKNAGVRWSRANEGRAQRQLAEQLAYDIDGGQISYDTVLGGTQQHIVVWSLGRPIRAFPAWEGNLEAELEHFRRDRLVDPPPPAAPGRRRRLVHRDRPGPASAPRGSHSAGRTAQPHPT